MIWRYPYNPRFFSSCLQPHLGRWKTATRLAGYRTLAQVLDASQTFDSHNPKIIDVTGTVRTVRKQKKIAFAAIGDGSTIRLLQVVLEPAHAEGLHTGTAVQITGEWTPSPGKEQSHELKAQSVRITGSVDPERYPLQKKYHTPEYLRTIPHLRLRTPFNALLTRLRSETEYWLHDFFHRHDFVKVQPPIITSSDCEGAGEVFTLAAKPPPPPFGQGGTEKRATTQSFFRSAKYLTVSSQLHLEAYIPEHHGVWTLSPTFRAEKSDTPRHLSEFSMLEVEMRTEDLDDVMDLTENMIRTLVDKLRQSKLGQELLRFYELGGIDRNTEGIATGEKIRNRWECLVGQPWRRITYKQALEKLQTAAAAGQAEFQSKPTWYDGFHLEHEKFIAAEFGQGSPVFVTDYPVEIKPFYMLPSETALRSFSDPNPRVACFDLLMPEVCEVAGGSLREHRLSQLVEAMSLHGLNKPQQHSTLAWYLELRQHGSVPHGGFGLGLDRVLGYLAGVPNIRDIVAFPRYYGTCEC